ncbi:MAG: WD40 repeat domain-containing protein [bacterium]
MKLLYSILFCVTLLLPMFSMATTLEQVISREHPTFNCTEATLAAGRDGMVYIANGGNPSGYVIRMNPDGGNKVGGSIHYASHNVAVNGSGTIAASAGHFQRSILLYNKNFTQTALCNDFLVSDAVGWDAPGRVEVGASGDFYGLDQHRQRILRINPVTGKIVTSYPLTKEADKEHDVNDFRVSEKAQTFVIYPYAEKMRCIGFDGKTKYYPSMPNMGGWDTDDDGNIYWIDRNNNNLIKLGPDGKQIAAVKLQMGDTAPTSEQYITSLRISGNDVYIKRRHQFELFQHYNMTTGEKINTVSIDYERLGVTFPNELWTAGQDVPFKIDFAAGGRNITPHWRVWANPIGTTEYKELKINNETLTVPADCAGIYQVKVTPETQPIQYDKASEYLVRTAIEIRQPDTKGSISVLTPNNRVYWGQGDEIPVRIVVRAAEIPGKVIIKMKNNAGVAVIEKTVDIKPGEKECSLSLAPTMLAGITVGKYILQAEIPGLTSVPQNITIGSGIQPQLFTYVQFGDYGATYPQVAIPNGYWEGPDEVAAHLKQTSKMGINMLVDRIGSPLQIPDLTGDHRIRGIGENIAKKLDADPLSTAPDKARLDAALLQTMAGYSSLGITEMAEPLGMDAGLPLNTGYDARKPEDMCKNITITTQALKSFSSFRGWVLSMNWWNFGGLKDDAVDDAEAKAYTDALKIAKDTGKWDPVLDKVSNRRYSFGVDAQKLFTDTARAVSPNIITANSAPYRKVEAYPPVSLSNVDEVDLHIQWEQVAPPYTFAHNVDFYKRPGKRAWAHPEVWNDAGTGDQALPALFDMIMRGADGVGFSGKAHPWGIKPEDNRLSDHGYLSFWRSLGEVTKNYGAWFTTLKNNDTVAIVADGRQFRIDEWQHITGRHFARLWEAYTTCMYNHTPASIIFTDDMTPNSLNKYKAVILVDQWVEMEPKLAETLKNAKAAGTAIFYDDTCRKELMADFTSLGIKFDKFEKDPSQAGDDGAYWRFQSYVRANLPAVAKAINAVTTAPAAVDIDEVFISESNNGDGKVLFAVNNTVPALDPGQMWRVSLALTSRVPVIAPIKLPADAKYVYDVFAMKKVDVKDGIVQADLRTIPARVYAMLPAEIGRINLQTTPPQKDGEKYNLSVKVQDTNGNPINFDIPVHIRLFDISGKAIEDEIISVGKDGFSKDYSAKNYSVIDAKELLSGISAKKQFVMAVGKWFDVPNTVATEKSFGPHIRDMVLSADGTTLFLNANNWDNNLYAIDTKAAAVKWRGRVGHYFAFAPQALKNGFAVQGFDFNSAEGYHTYLVGNDGKLARRFALYGLPKRLVHRFVPAILNDRINNFAVAPDGSWVASAGDLGLAVWNADGKLLWKQDWWKKERHTATLAVQSDNKLIVIEGMLMTIYQAADGTRMWQQSLAATGEVRSIRVNNDGHTIAIQTTTEGGRVFVQRDGKPLTTLITNSGTIDLSADGSTVAVTEDNLLKLYSITSGLQWTFACDNTARCPHISPDGKQVTVTSDLGSLYILNIDGTLQMERDLGAVATTVWLRDNTLVAGTWEGTISWFANNILVKSMRIQPDPAITDMRDKLLKDDGAPTTRISEWSNAEAQAKPITPNLLADNKAIIRFVPSGNWGGEIALQQNANLLYDGKTDPPADTWLGWHNVNQFAETSPFNYLLLDFFNTRVKLTGITLVEDASHPESWLRDATLEYWDVTKEQWLPIMPLLSNSAVHTHILPQSVEAARFRIVMPWGLVGNLRLAEIVMHGDTLGSSHPDVIAKKPLAVLFDENEDDMKNLTYPGSPAKFILTGAYSGGRCIAIDADKQVAPIWRPPFGHVIPNWKFEIVEKPEPGQYRWLQFAWKALDAKTTGITLRIDGMAFNAGKPTSIMSVNPKKVADIPPTEWSTVRIDLWDYLKRPATIDMMAIAAEGGPAAFDQVVLGRTEGDFPK